MAENQTEVLRRLAAQEASRAEPQQEAEPQSMMGVVEAYEAKHGNPAQSMMDVVDQYEAKHGNHAALKQELAQSTMMQVAEADHDVQRAAEHTRQQERDR